MNDVKPDLIGTQEINSYWLSDLKNELKDYESYGVKRGGDSEEKNSEMNAVFWNKNKFSCLTRIRFGSAKPRIKKANIPIWTKTAKRQKQVATEFAPMLC